MFLESEPLAKSKVVAFVFCILTAPKELVKHYFCLLLLLFMKISVLGTLHPKSLPCHLNHLIQTIVATPPEHTVTVDAQYAHYLQQQNIQVPPHLIGKVGKDTPTNLLVSIGGDGTFLRAAHLVAGTPAVILGINTGRLGFLANLSPQEFCFYWQRILRGEYSTEERSLIQVRTPDGVERFALNEIAILKRDTASMISIRTWANNHFLATFEGDGLLISTPTGSTAYALSANGPIVHPQCPVWDLCPIAPHMLNMRPIVLPDTTCLRMEVTTRTNSYLLSVDGKSIPLKNGTELVVERCPKQLRLVEHPEQSYFDTLRLKLMWGQDTRNP